MYSTKRRRTLDDNERSSDTDSNFGEGSSITDPEEAMSTETIDINGTGQEEEKPYFLEKTNHVKVRKYGIEEYSYKARFNDKVKSKRVADMKTDLHNMFSDIMKEVEQNYSSEDKVRLSIDHAGLDREMTIHLQNRANITPELIMDRFASVLNSKKDLQADETFEVRVGTMKKSQGGGGRCYIVNTDLNSKECTIIRKKSMIMIKNANDKEPICLARAITMSFAKLTDTGSYKYMQKALHSNSPFSQRSKALDLLKNVGLPSDRNIGVRDIYLFEKFLDVQIVVISGDLGNNICYEGFVKRERKIFLFLHNQHFHSIVNIQGLLPNRKLCFDCLEWFPRDSRRHICRARCGLCTDNNCQYDNTSLTCPDCNFTCRNSRCFLNHKKPVMYKRGEKKGTQKSPSQCDLYHKCKSCLTVIDTSKRCLSEHECGDWFCHQCSAYVPEDHLCYYRISKPKFTSGKFIYYDFETTQSNTISCSGKGYENNPVPNCPSCIEDYLCSDCRKCVNCTNSYCGLHVHRANFVVAQSSCEICKNDPWTNNSDMSCGACGTRCSACYKFDREGNYVPFCDNGICGKREVSFKGDDTVKLFCNWLLQPGHKGYTCIAHNSRGFDAHIILNHCLDNSITPTDIIYQGSKIMKMRIGVGLNLTFLDSVSFLPMPLKKLPKALGVANVEKGSFPHHFNVEGNFDYVGEWPGKHEFGYDFMSVNDRHEFEVWYDSVKDTVFDFQEKMLEYNRSDVSVLRECCTKFRDLILSVTTFENAQSPGIDVFAHATIASCTMQIIRQLMLEETHDVVLKDGRKTTAILKAGVWKDSKTDCHIPSEQIAYSKFLKSQIPHIPGNGYRKRNNQSRKAICWLEYISSKIKRPIRHALNKGEFKLPGTNYLIDGVDEETGKLYEFHGCRWHGHFCQPNRQMKDPRTGHTLEQLHAITIARSNDIRSRGFELEEIYECQFDRIIESDPEVRQFVNSLDFQPPIKIRDALYGGRVSTFKLFHDCQENEKIQYLDFTSLYPWVNWNMGIPQCHPDIITDPKVLESLDLSNVYGLALAKVLPPPDLYVPVLPFRCNGKLKFPLCGKCSSNENQSQCNCSDSERAIIGTWVVDELNLAVIKGYRIIKLYEVYSYADVSQYDPVTQTGGLFSDYVKTFLKLKQEASGYPENCLSDQDKLEYVKTYEEKQGIRLDPNNIAPNPGLRLTAKLILNSVWGKFSQRSDLPAFKFIFRRLDLDKLRNNPTKEVVDFHIINHDVIVVEMRSVHTFEEESRFTCDIIGVMTTALARIHLYRVIGDLGFSVLYCDTDGFLFVQKNGLPDIQTGPLLGDLTSELNDDVYVQTYGSSGPKCYFLQLSDQSTEIKLKGITLNYKNRQVLNLENVKKVVLGSLDQITTPMTTTICRDKVRGVLYNRPFTKIYQKVFTKRRILKDSHITLPFGYKPC